MSFRNFAFRRSLVSFALIFAVHQAKAEETYPSKFVEGWEIYGWDDGCWMVADFEDGTTFTYNMALSDGAPFIILRNSNWRSINDKEVYSIRFEIDDWSFTEKSRGITNEGLPPGISFGVDDSE